jgi:hypothetical protein
LLPHLFVETPIIEKGKKQKNFHRKIFGITKSILLLGIVKSKEIKTIGSTMIYTGMNAGSVSPDADFSYKL